MQVNYGTRQKLVVVFFKGVKIGEYRLDMVAEDQIILEFKAVSELNSVFEAQVLSYLKASGLKLGLLINFRGEKAEVTRIVN
jgi:GxxExxY protein